MALALDQVEAATSFGSGGPSSHFNSHVDKPTNIFKDLQGKSK